MTRESPPLEDLLRKLAPQVLGVLTRRNGQFDACEDAVQEALLEASLQWAQGCLPDNPFHWLMTVAQRRLVDQWRSESARRRREGTFTLQFSTRQPEGGAPDSCAGDDVVTPDADDTLMLLYLCCHPALSPPSQLALTLRAVGGLTCAQIASAFMVPEATMAQRISRAKGSITRAGARFEVPTPAETMARTAVVQQVLYLIFNEGYAASSGRSLQRTDLTGEAIRLTRLLLGVTPATNVARAETCGLLALMLLTDARRSARTLADGALVPLSEQDRSLWDAGQIREGVLLLTSTLGKVPIGPYQVQAAIAAIHDEASRVEDTDWPQILALYEVLEQVAPSPIVTLNRAVAVAMVKGPLAGLAVLGTVEKDPQLARSHRPLAVRAHLLELSGHVAAAREAYLVAAAATASLPERRYLAGRAARLTQQPHRPQDHSEG
ncbi:RNA polymerase sigma factor (sigma-70 family) [Arthrobacter sp. PL16]|uniref:RNA polymerase sigma factor n=1 Tax=Arthrobacter sp. PL16 TaxID=3071720 RepID=UPI002E0182D1|nr:RNA polymerase sigma factor (sigma-70 family) [Arthrobacter sp. PL16]